jgi:hypothetical protein
MGKRDSLARKLIISTVFVLHAGMLALLFRSSLAVKSNFEGVILKKQFTMKKATRPTRLVSREGSPPPIKALSSLSDQSPFFVLRFMLQLLNLPPLHQPKPAEPVNPHQDSGDDAASTQTHEPVTQNPAPTEDEGQEQLALNLAAEILGCPDKKSAAGKAYLSMLAKTVAGLTFRRSEQEAVKKMRKLLDW